MAITLRLTDEQEQALERLMELTGQATKSKAILHMVENAEYYITNANLLSEFCKHRMVAAQAEVEQGNILNDARKLHVKLF